MKFESVIYEMFGNVMRLVKAQPINLGGYSASGGGAGGPPGGYIGMLPQTKVAYDLSELATIDTPESGASLLDNLNHIRYRLDTVEGSGNRGIDVYEDEVLVASGVHELEFANVFDVTLDETRAIVTMLASGIMSDTTYSGIFGEDLTSYVDGAEDHFTVSGTIYDESLAVYLNGIRQSQTEYTIDEDKQGFTTDFVPISGDTLQVDYVEAFDGYFHTHSQYALADDVYTKEEIALLLDSHSRTVNQQIVFTVMGSGSVVSGLISTRVWAHDVNDGATISEVLCGFDTPPTSEVRVDVLKNGDTIFNEPSYVSVASGAYTGNRITDFYDATFVKDDYFQIQIEQGNVVAADMTLHIRFSYLLD